MKTRSSVIRYMEFKMPVEHPGGDTEEGIRYMILGLRGKAQV